MLFAEELGSVVRNSEPLFAGVMPRDGTVGRLQLLAAGPRFGPAVLPSEGGVWAKPHAARHGVHPAAGRARSTAMAPRLSVPLTVLASRPHSCQLLVVNCITAN